MRNCSYYEEERNNDIIRAYRELMSASSKINFTTQAECMEIVVNSPSKRFWVTPEKLYKVILRLNKEDLLLEMKPIRREMFLELYSMYKSYREKYKSNQSILDVCCIIVGNPAPKFYIKADTAYRLYKKQSKINFAKQKRYV